MFNVNIYIKNKTFITQRVINILFLKYMYYIYLCIYVCVCVCVKYKRWGGCFRPSQLCKYSIP